MAHFAQIEDGVVVGVLVVNNEDIEDGDGVEQESIGIAFLKNLLGGDTEWVQTSYNNNFRKQYAPVGVTYNAEKYILIAEQPYPSWTMDENDEWEAPENKPIGDINNIHSWDEENLKWITYKCVDGDGDYTWLVNEDSYNG